MNNKDDRELLEAVFHALFGPTLKGKYMVEVHGSYVVDTATGKDDAIEQAKNYFSSNLNRLNFSTVKIDDLLNK